MQLIADRFARLSDGRTIDLATGDPVVLIVERAAEGAEQARWAVRCDGSQKLQHRALAMLVDWGALGGSQRFEAWRCGETCKADGPEAIGAVDNASRFLAACGLTPGIPGRGTVRWSRRGPVLLPDRAAGYPSAVADENGNTASLEGCGLAMCERKALSPTADVFRCLRRREPQVLVLFGPPGSGKSALLLELARQARLEGLVPVAAHLASTVDSAIPGGVCLIDDDSRGDVWPALLRASIGSPRPHVVLVTRSEEMQGVDGIELDRLPADVLLAAVRPRRLDAGAARRLRLAASTAHGLPGRFAEVLGLGNRYGASGSRPRAKGPVSMVAEEQAVYSVGDVESSGGNKPASAVWPAPGELRSLRNWLNEAIEFAARGRHARGVRQMRRAIGALARRHDWVHAGQGTIALASTLMTRGDAEGALRALGEARAFGAHAGGDTALAEIAALCGEAWIDRARLDEAESVIGSALVAARSARDARRVGLASLALGRCLFWQGRYGEAEAAVGLRDLPPSDSAIPVRAACLAARAAVGRGEHAFAMTHVSAAASAAAADASAGARALAKSTAAFVHLAANDLDGVDRDVTDALLAARAAHDPLCAIRSRLLRAEADRRRGRQSAARTAIARLSARRLPAILRARLDLLRVLMSSESPVEAVAGLQASSGLRALELYAPDSPSARARDPFIGEMVSILDLCQTAAEETALLTEVCVRVRRHLRAASVAFVVAGSVVAADGARIDGGGAERAAAAGQVVAPRLCEDRLEAAAPVRCGGVTIGALAARWTIGASRDLSGAPALLIMAAAAAAPAVAAVLSRRREGSLQPPGEILGVSVSIAEVRQAIVRAAAAPYAVLVEGESGSGKELVVRAVHRTGPRRERPFCTLNCAALPDDLVETELFGHARGAFTGAIAERAGVFEQAHNGTLFLDEVGDLSSRAQAKLLRVVQEGELRRVGENVSRRIDVRLVAATNRCLREDAAAGRFRTDLLYRLDVIHI